MTSQTNLLSDILQELRGLRKDVTKNSTSHRSNSAHRSSRSKTPLVPRITTPSRKLLQAIADAPVKIDICWYHNKFGIAANPRNCPGPHMCKFNLEHEIAKMKGIIAKVSSRPTPAQDRLNRARNASVTPKNEPKITVFQPTNATESIPMNCDPPEPPKPISCADETDDLAAELADLSD